MFKIDFIQLSEILADFDIRAKVEFVTELQRSHYEKQNSRSKELRLIIKVELDNHSPVVVRFKNEKGVSRELIEEQCRFANILLKNGIETPKQYICDGNFARRYSVCEYDVIVTVEQFVEGQLNFYDSEIAKAAGNLLAKTHNIAERTNFHVNNKVLFDPFKENDLFSVAEFKRHRERLMHREPDLYGSIMRQHEECISRISVLQNEPRYAVQGDLSDCNLYKTKDGGIGVFDFNCCGDNNLFFDAVMQAVFVARLMDYPESCAENPEELILPTFLTAYNRERPFSDIQKSTYPYLYALISAFWKADILWNENSLHNSIEANDNETISMWMEEIDRRIHALPQKIYCF